MSGNINLTTNISSTTGYGIDFSVSLIPQRNTTTIYTNYIIGQPFTYYYGNPQNTNLLSDISASLTLSGGWGIQNTSYNIGDWISITNLSGQSTFYKISGTYGTYTLSNPRPICNISGSTFILSGYGATAKFVWTGTTYGWIAVT